MPLSDAWTLPVAAVTNHCRGPRRKRPISRLQLRGREVAGLTGLAPPAGRLRENPVLGLFRLPEAPPSWLGACSVFRAEIPLLTASVSPPVLQVRTLCPCPAPVITPGTSTAIRRLEAADAATPAKSSFPGGHSSRPFADAGTVAWTSGGAMPGSARTPPPQRGPARTPGPSRHLRVPFPLSQVAPGVLPATTGRKSPVGAGVSSPRHHWHRSCGPRGSFFFFFF